MIGNRKDRGRSYESGPRLLPALRLYRYLRGKAILTPMGDKRAGQVRIQYSTIQYNTVQYKSRQYIPGREYSCAFDGRYGAPPPIRGMRGRIPQERDHGEKWKTVSAIAGKNSGVYARDRIGIPEDRGVGVWLSFDN